MMKATAEASPNIALIKYWGKRDTSLFLPQNNSLSLTLDQALKTITTIEFSESLTSDEIMINNEPVSEKAQKNITAWLTLVRELYKVNDFARIQSESNFPMGTGIASSASGFAALATAVNEAAQLALNAQELSILARRGSGSAIRSVMGGFVEWQAGSKADGSDSIAIQVAPPEHWPEIRDVLAIVQTEEKKVSSREGMQQTVKTSALFKERLLEVPARLENLKKAIQAKDFETLAQITMQDSDSMHACMKDTTPSLRYLTETSEKIKELILKENEKKVIAGYTFDAGPNAHIITLEEHADAIKKLLESVEGIQEIKVSGPGAGPQIKSEHLF